jgi:putative ABC transport system permease protein
LGTRAASLLLSADALSPFAGFDVLTGIDLAAFNRLSGGFRFLRGGRFQNDDDIIVDEYYARERKLNVGNTITLANHSWRVSGIFESGKLSHICARLNVLQALTGNPGRLSQIYLKVDDPARAQVVVEQLRVRMRGYPIYTMEEFTSLLTINRPRTNQPHVAGT